MGFERNARHLANTTRGTAEDSSVGLRGEEHGEHDGSGE
jgi:hypothetical protein